MKAIILGGGISGISLAHFLQESKKIKKITILEKDKIPGGLLRSFNCKGIAYDVGPHIIFSKYKDILKKNILMLGKNVQTLKSGQIKLSIRINILSFHLKMNFINFQKKIWNTV